MILETVEAATTEETVVNSFEDVRSFLSEAPHIGQGGCAIAALAMLKWLENNGQGEGAKVVYLYRSFDNDLYQQNMEALSDAAKSPTSCLHAVILFNGQLMDCDSTFQFSDYAITQVLDDPDFVMRSINTDNWNYFFDRGHVAHISEVLGVDLSEVAIKF